VDLRADGIGNDAATVLDLIREIAAIEIDDGMTYDGAGADAESIREEDQYAGVRVTMGCTLATAPVAVRNLSSQVRQSVVEDGG
jgi:hypothetical protein